MNHNYYDYASTALTLVNVTNTTRLYGGEKEKEKLVFVYMVYYQICVLVCGGGGDFSVSPERENHVQVQFTVASQIYVTVNVESFIHAFFHLFLFQLWLLCGGKYWVNDCISVIPDVSRASYELRRGESERRSSKS